MEVTSVTTQFTLVQGGGSGDPRRVILEIANHRFSEPAISLAIFLVQIKKPHSLQRGFLYDNVIELAY